MTLCFHVGCFNIFGKLCYGLLFFVSFPILQADKYKRTFITFECPIKININNQFIHIFGGRRFC